MASRKQKSKKTKTKTTETGEKLISKNRRAYRDYDLGDRYEAGLVLKGTEVKSCRAGKAHVNDAYVQLRQGEAWLIGSHIADQAGLATLPLDAVDAHVDDGSTRADPVAADHARAADGGHQDIGTTADGRQIAGAGMGDGHRAMLAQ